MTTRKARAGRTRGARKREVGGAKPATRRSIGHRGGDAAIRFLCDTGDRAINRRIDRFGDFRLPKGSREAEHFQKLVSMIRDYSSREKPPRPMSIAVFGPPGSGKSFAVEQLARYSHESLGAKGEAPFLEINLTQHREAREVWSAVSKFLGVQTDPITPPFLFLDEFDCAKGDRALGWIQEFLAPMQDGAFTLDGNRLVDIRRAILLFAGGTAHTFREFQGRHDPEFRDSKGPDFASRLRGTLDVEGINGAQTHRPLRRALVLRRLLEKRAPQLVRDNGTVAIDRALAESLLAVGRYRHGTRSMEALLDMCELTHARRFTARKLPPKNLRSLHVSTGPLAGLRIGLAANESDSGDVFEILARKLLERGAALAYGGDISSPTLQRILKVVEDRPEDLLLEKPPPLFLNLRPFHAARRTTSPKRTERHIDRRRLRHSLLAEEKRALGIRGDFPVWDKSLYHARHHIGWSLSLFRMRCRLAQEIDALVVLGGKKTNSWGRFPGVIEEAMLALAFKRPIYILGHLGGAAEDLGKLLGLSATPGPPPRSLELPKTNHFMLDPELSGPWSDRFAIPTRRELPIDHGQLQEFLASCAPLENGLNEKENRGLFEERDPQLCVEQLVAGLRRYVESGHADMPRPRHLSHRRNPDRR